MTGLWCIWKIRNEKLWEDVEHRSSILFQLSHECLYQRKQVISRGIMRQNAQVDVVLQRAKTTNVNFTNYAGGRPSVRVRRCEQ